MTAVEHCLRTADQRALYQIGLQGAGARSRAFSGDRVRSTRRKVLDGAEALPCSGRVLGLERGRAQRRLSSCPGTLPVGETRGCGGKALAFIQEEKADLRNVGCFLSTLYSRCFFVGGMLSCFCDQLKHFEIGYWLFFNIRFFGSANCDFLQKIFDKCEFLYHSIKNTLRRFFRCFTANAEFFSSFKNYLSGIECRKINSSNIYINIFNIFIVIKFFIYFIFELFNQINLIWNSIRELSNLRAQVGCSVFFLFETRSFIFGLLNFFLIVGVNFLKCSTKKRDKKTTRSRQKYQSSRYYCLILRNTLPKLLKYSPAKANENNQSTNKRGDSFSDFRSHTLNPEKSTTKFLPIVGPHYGP